MKIARGTKVRKMVFSRKVADCPRCGGQCKRHSMGRRNLHEIGSHSPIILQVDYSKHWCRKCKKHFSVSMGHIAQLAARYTNRVKRSALDALRIRTLEQACKHMRERYHVEIPTTTLHDWASCAMERAEKAEREATRLRYLVGAVYNATCDRPLEKAQEVHLFEVIDSLRSETTGKPAPTDQPKERISSDE